MSRPKGLLALDALAAFTLAGDRLVRTVTDWLFFPQCPLCPERHHNLEAHIVTNHAGDDDLMRSRK